MFWCLHPKTFIYLREFPGTRKKRKGDKNTKRKHFYGKKYIPCIPKATVEDDGYQGCIEMIEA